MAQPVLPTDGAGLVYRRDFQIKVELAGLRPSAPPFDQKVRAREETLKKIMLLAVAVLALASVGVAAGVATAGNGNGAAVLTMTSSPTPAFPIIDSGYNFQFFDGNGNLALFTPTAYHEVVAPSGVNNEVLQGTIANDSGQAVIYSANSGPPVTAGQTCWDFATGNTTANWQMTISASGNYTLTCHFGS
jgi:hypothetical protein